MPAAPNQWGTGVELGDLAGPMMMSWSARISRSSTAEHVEPLVALVRAQLGLAALGRDHHLPRVHPAGAAVSGTTARPLRLLRLQPDARVADLGRADELVERDPVRLRDRQQELEAGLALARTRAATACSSRSRSPPPARSASTSRCGAHSLQPGTDLGQNAA